VAASRFGGHTSRIGGGEGLPLKDTGASYVKSGATRRKGRRKHGLWWAEQQRLLEVRARAETWRGRAPHACTRSLPHESPAVLEGAADAEPRRRGNGAAALVRRWKRHGAQRNVRAASPRAQGANRRRMSTQLMMNRDARATAGWLAVAQEPLLQRRCPCYVRRHSINQGMRQRRGGCARRGAQGRGDVGHLCECNNERRPSPPLFWVRVWCAPV
jgi:hypothetical protein